MLFSVSRSPIVGMVCKGKRCVFARQRALRLHAAPEFLVEPFNHVCGAERLPLGLGEAEECEEFVAALVKLVTTLGQRLAHVRSKAVYVTWAASALVA